MDSPSPYLPPRHETSREPEDLPSATVRFLLRTGAVIFFGMSLILVIFTIIGLRGWGQGVPQGYDLLYASRQSTPYRVIQSLAFTGFAVGCMVTSRKLFRYQRNGVIWGRWMSLLTALLNLALFGVVVLIARSVSGYDESRLLGNVRSDMRTLWIQLVLPLVMLMNLYNPLVVQWMKSDRRK